MATGGWGMAAVQGSLADVVFDPFVDSIFGFLGDSSRERVERVEATRVDGELGVISCCRPAGRHVEAPIHQGVECPDHEQGRGQSGQIGENR